MAKSRLRKNQSERSDLLCHIIKLHNGPVVLESAFCISHVTEADVDVLLMLEVVLEDAGGHLSLSLVLKVASKTAWFILQEYI